MNDAREISPPQRITCPHCNATIGTPCLTRSGKPAPHSHRARFDRAMARLRTEQMIVAMREDDPRFKLAKGDLLLCEKYPYDAKVTILHRLSDGYDPECNQYIPDVRFVAFANEYTPENAA